MKHNGKRNSFFVFPPIFQNKYLVPSKNSTAGFYALSKKEEKFHSICTTFMVVYCHNSNR